MRAVIAAGGTAGHINPALSIADEIKKNEPDSNIIFIGREDGMEAKLVPSRGYKIKYEEIHGFERKISFSGFLFNLRSCWFILSSTFHMNRFYKEFKPDIVIGCGGYISGPVVRSAASAGIPTAIHEQNSFPGVTTRLLAKKVDRIFTANDDARKALGYPGKTTVVGNPISDKIGNISREEARDKLGIGRDMTCILSFGGSLGAETINKIMIEVFSRCLDRKDLYFIHASGGMDEGEFDQAVADRNLDVSKLNCRISRYIYDMPYCLAAADLVVSRAGASTISELAAAGRASYLVPSPNVAENHQYYNALTLVNCGAAEVEEEKDLLPDQTALKILDLIENKDKLKEMGENALTVAALHSASDMYEGIKELLKGKNEKNREK